MLLCHKECYSVMTSPSSKTQFQMEKLPPMCKYRGKMFRFLVLLCKITILQMQLHYVTPTHITVGDMSHRFSVPSGLFNSSFVSWYNTSKLCGFWRVLCVCVCVIASLTDRGYIMFRHAVIHLHVHFELHTYSHTRAYMLVHRAQASYQKGVA